MLAARRPALGLSAGRASPPQPDVLDLLNLKSPCMLMEDSFAREREKEKRGMKARWNDVRCGREVSVYECV
jgi:hypothetical protein